MLALSSGFERHVFFDECIASAQPLSEPGMVLNRAMPDFLPGDEDRLRAFWDDTQAMQAWSRRHAPHLEAHLRNLQIQFLHEDPSTWGAVELARMHSVAVSLKWILENANCLQASKQAQAADADAVNRVVEILSAHCAGGGFYLIAPAGSRLDAARTRMQEANAHWTELENRQRAQTAADLGLDPIRLKSDVTLPFGDPKIDVFRSNPNMQEVESTAHHARFRFTVLGESRTAREILLQRRRECLELESAEIGVLQDRLFPLVKSLKNALETAGWIDIHFVRARWADAHGACRPEIAQDGAIMAQDAAHPHIERQVTRLGRQYQRISFCLQPPITSLTGANMGGKTAFLRTVGLFQLLFQKGYFLPARHFSSLLFRSLAWIGTAPDSPHLGLSSFGRECRNLAEALALPEPRLWLVDEFARSTAVEEGMALTGALMDALSSPAAFNHHVFAGHIQNPPTRRASLSHLHTGGLDFETYRHNALTIDPEKALAASMDYRIYEGKSGGSDALRIAKALGIPGMIIDDAAQILQVLRHPGK